jgi:hypothetical protein
MLNFVEYLKRFLVDAPPELVFKDHPLLPAKSGKTRAHILKELPKGPAKWPNYVRLWDCIATTLDYIKDYPNALQDFFDPDVTSFKFRRNHKGDDYETMESFLIWRRGQEILVGLSCHLC